MKRITLRVMAFFLISTILFVYYQGCSGSACIPGATQECLCVGSAQKGVQVCKGDGSSWDVCNCGKSRSEKRVEDAGSLNESSTPPEQPDNCSVRCGTVCVDLQNDSKNCGRCGNQCKIEEACFKGACQNLQAQVVHGKVDSSYLFPSVVKVAAAGLGDCTGTLISPQHVLTAGHCVCSRDIDGYLTDCKNSGKIYAFTDSYSSSSATYNFSKVIVSPDFRMKLTGNNTVEEAQSDIAIVELDECVSGLQPHSIISNNPQKKDAVTLVGFGKYTCKKNPDGQRRVGKNYVSEVTYDSIIIKEFFSKAITAPGDSGGPVFLHQGGKYIVAGVTSRGTCRNWIPFDASVSTNVYSYRSFISKYVSNTCQKNNFCPNTGKTCSTGQKGVCGAGVWECKNNQPTCRRINGPSPEKCGDNADNDCDGQINEGCNCPNTGKSCSTGEEGVCGPGIWECKNNAPHCRRINGPSPEKCGDKADNDCDGQTDEGCNCPNTGQRCSTGEKGVCGPGVWECKNNAPHCRRINGPSTEKCGDNVDNDCDGQIDEGCCGCSSGQLRACNKGGVQSCSNCQWGTCKTPDRPLYRFRSTNGDQAHKFQTNTSATSGFVIENGGRPVFRVFSYNPGYLTKVMQCSRTSSRDYILTLLGSSEYQAINGKGFTCYDNGWWVLNVAETRYPGYSNVPICLRGSRPGDSDHIFTLNRQELVGLNRETSGFRVWAP